MALLCKWHRGVLAIGHGEVRCRAIGRGDHVKALRLVKQSSNDMVQPLFTMMHSWKYKLSVVVRSALVSDIGSIAALGSVFSSSSCGVRLPVFPPCPPRHSVFNSDNSHFLHAAHRRCLCLILPQVTSLVTTCRPRPVLPVPPLCLQ